MRHLGRRAQRPGGDFHNRAADSASSHLPRGVNRPQSRLHFAATRAPPAGATERGLRLRSPPTPTSGREAPRGDTATTLRAAPPPPAHRARAPGKGRHARSGALSGRQSREEKPRAPSTWAAKPRVLWGLGNHGGSLKTEPTRKVASGGRVAEPGGRVQVGPPGKSSRLLQPTLVAGDRKVQIHGP